MYDKVQQQSVRMSLSSFSCTSLHSTGRAYPRKPLYLFDLVVIGSRLPTDQVRQGPAGVLEELRLLDGAQEVEEGSQNALREDEVAEVRVLACDVAQGPRCLRLRGVCTWSLMWSWGLDKSSMKRGMAPFSVRHWVCSVVPVAMLVKLQAASYCRLGTVWTSNSWINRGTTLASMISWIGDSSSTAVVLGLTLGQQLADSHGAQADLGQLVAVDKGDVLGQILDLMFSLTATWKVIVASFS